MIRWFCVGLFALFLWQCVTFRFTLPDDPHVMIDYMAVCKKLDKEQDFEKEIASEVICTGDSTIYALIKINNIQKTLEVQWKWYNPENQIVKVSKSLQINQKNVYLQYFVAWDVLANRFFSDKKGRWTAVFFINGKFFSKIEFSIH